MHTHISRLLVACCLLFGEHCVCLIDVGLVVFAFAQENELLRLCLLFEVRSTTEGSSEENEPLRPCLLFEVRSTTEGSSKENEHLRLCLLFEVRLKVPVKKTNTYDCLFFKIN